MVDPSEDDVLDEEGRPVFMPEVARFDPHDLASQTDFIICLGGDGEGRVPCLPLPLPPPPLSVPSPIPGHRNADFWLVGDGDWRALVRIPV